MSASPTVCRSWNFECAPAFVPAGQHSRPSLWYMALFPFIRLPAVQTMVPGRRIFLLMSLMYCIFLPDIRERFLCLIRFMISSGKSLLTRDRSLCRSLWGVSAGNFMRSVPIMTTSRSNVTKAIFSCRRRKQIFADERCLCRYGQRNRAVVAALGHFR